MWVPLMTKLTTLSNIVCAFPCFSQLSEEGDPKSEKYVGKIGFIGRGVLLKLYSAGSVDKGKKWMGGEIIFCSSRKFSPPLCSPCPPAPDGVFSVLTSRPLAPAATNATTIRRHSTSPCSVLPKPVTCILFLCSRIYSMGQTGHRLSKQNLYPGHCLLQCIAMAIPWKNSSIKCLNQLTFCADICTKKWLLTSLVLFHKYVLCGQRRLI